MYRNVNGGNNLKTLTGKGLRKQITATSTIGMASYNGGSQKKVDVYRNHRISWTPVMRVLCESQKMGLKGKERADFESSEMQPSQIITGILE